MPIKSFRNNLPVIKTIRSNVKTLSILIWWVCLAYPSLPINSVLNKMNKFDWSFFKLTLNKKKIRFVLTTDDNNMYFNDPFWHSYLKIGFRKILIYTYGDLLYSGGLKSLSSSHLFFKTLLIIKICVPIKKFDFKRE